MSSENLDTASSRFDVIALHNIDDEDFVFEYDKSAGNYPYTIPAGEVRRFPQFLADHALKHLIDNILNKRKISTSNLVARESLAAQIVVEHEALQQKPRLSPGDARKAEIEELNKPSDLDSILAKHKTLPKNAPRVADEAPVGPRSDPDDDMEGKPIDTTDEPVVPPPAVAPMPTRGEIYDYGKNVLKMTYDEKTMKAFEKMTIPKLLVEIGDPRESLV